MRLKETLKSSGIILGIKGDKVLIQPTFSKLPNRNHFVVGGPGSYKTQSYVISNILHEKDCSIVVTDPKGEVYEMTSEIKRKQGYEVHVINFVNMNVSDRYNCFDYIRKDRDATTVANTLVAARNNPKNKDIWYNAQLSLLKALILYCIHENPPEHRNMEGVLNFLQEYDTEANEGGLSDLDEQFLSLNKMHPARRAYELGFKKSVDKTRSSIIISLLTTIGDYVDQEVAEFTGFSDFLLSDVGKRKIALYVIIPVMDNTWEGLINLFFNQMFQELYCVGAENNDRLSQPVIFLLDEFPNLGRFEDNEAVKNLYKNTADSIGNYYKVTIDYKNMMAIDMLRYTENSTVGNGASVNESDVLYLLWCLHKKADEANVTSLAKEFILETKLQHVEITTDDKGNKVTNTWTETVYSLKSLEEVCQSLKMSTSDIIKVKTFRTGLDTSYPGGNADPENPGNPDMEVASKVIAGAYSVMNREPKIRYRFGGPGIDLGYADCSEFTSYVFLKYANMNIGPNTFEQVKKGIKISSIKDLAPGDLVLFQGTYATSGPSHVGIYISNGNFIHLHGAENLGTIDISNINEAYWTQHFMMGRRVLQTTGSVSQKDFIKKILPESEATFKTNHIFTSITIAQAIIESGWGNDDLPKLSNNLFGIKADNWNGPYIEMPTYEYYGGVKVRVMAKFRVYSSFDGSILDHAKFLVENSRYAENGVFSSTDYIAQAYALGRSGYATNSDYPMLLINMIREYKLNQYDN